MKQFRSIFRKHIKYLHQILQLLFISKTNLPFTTQHPKLNKLAMVIQETTRTQGANNNIIKQLSKSRVRETTFTKNIQAIQGAQIKEYHNLTGIFHLTCLCAIIVRKRC